MNTLAAILDTTLYMNTEIWYLLINSEEQDKEHGVYLTFYNYGEHLGSAVDKAMQTCLDYNYTNPKLIEASLLESLESLENYNDLIHVNEEVYMNSTTHLYPISDPDIEFIPPIGIVKSVEDGENEYELIKECFVAYGQNDDNIYLLELVVAEPDIIDVFLKTIDFLPTIDGFWIYLYSDREDEPAELWVAKHFVDKALVKNFLISEQSNTLQNGFVSLVVHSLSGETNLTLDDHKIIKLTTKDEPLFADFIGQVIDLGYQQTTDFYSLENGFYHWHYRPANSLSRPELKAMLQEQKFELIDG